MTMRTTDNKHAYLIMAHKADHTLSTLLKMLDCNHNDIYIHFDLKSKDNPYNLSDFVNQSQLFFTKRIKVYWSHISQCKAMYTLWEEAHKNGPYCYYHLISGVDLPIKTQSQIHQFFNIHNGKNFIGISSNSIPEKYNYHYFHPKYHGLQWCQKFVISFERAIGYRNNYLNKFTLKRGCNWSSLTEEAIELMLHHKNEVLKALRYANCPDECITQTIIYNSYLRDTIFNIDDEFESCMRLIDWQRGTPYSWTANDFEEIKASNKIFARKIADEILANLIFETYGK